MLLTELAVQNVLGFPAAARIALKAGLNAVVSPEADLVQLVRAVLFPDPDDVAMAAPAGTRRAALTLEGRDGQTWRLVRDFGGGRSLLRADPQTRQAVRVAEEPADIARHLGLSVGLPDRESWRAHLCIAVEDLPHAAGRAKVAVAVPAPGEEGAPPSREEARRRLPDLRVELEKAERFERAQDALYTLQNRQADLAGGTRVITELEEQIAEVAAKIDEFARVKDVTAGIEQRIRKFPELNARREGALAELARKRKEVEEALGVEPGLDELVRSPVFYGGLLAGLACVAAALALGMRWLWGLDIVGFGAAAFEAWRWVGRVEDADRGRRKLLDLEEMHKRIARQYELESAPVTSAIRALGVNSPEEVLQRLEERDSLEARRLALVRELETRRADPALLALEQQKLAVEREMREREAAVNAMGFARDVAAIRREIQLCEQTLAGVSGGPGGNADLLATPVERAADLARTDPRTLLESFRDRLAQYLMALTDRRYLGLRVGAPGPYLVVGAAGLPAPLSALPLADQDLVYLATRLALAEKVAAPAKLPLVVDDPGVVVDGAHRALFVKMLRALGALTQVVVRAREEPPAAAVDHVAKAVAAR